MRQINTCCLHVAYVRPSRDTQEEEGLFGPRGPLTQPDFFSCVEGGGGATGATAPAPCSKTAPSNHSLQHLTSKMKLAIGSLLVAGAAAFAPAANSRVSSSALNLAVGEVAPDFALVDQNGKTVKRSSFKKPLVVYFYPADSTPGCTVQATEFNEQILDIRKTYGAGEYLIYCDACACDVLP